MGILSKISLTTARCQQAHAGSRHVREHLVIVVHRAAAWPSKTALHDMCRWWAGDAIVLALPAAVVPGAPLEVTPRAGCIRLYDILPRLASHCDGEHGWADGCAREDGQDVPVAVVHFPRALKRVFAVPTVSYRIADLRGVPAVAAEEGAHVLTPPLLP